LAAGDFYTVPDSSAFDFQSLDFTIEMWLYPVSGNSGYRSLYGKRATAATVAPVQAFIDPSGVLTVFAANAASAESVAWTVTITASSSPAVGQWSHFAMVRSGSTITVYLNGASVGSSSALGGSALVQNNAAFCIGSTYSGGAGDAYFGGYIDEFRVSKGVARYTASFTPATAAFADASGLTVPVVGTGSGGSGLSWSSVPASATASGTAGQIAYDAPGTFYLCTATNTWRRTTLSSWVSDPYFSSVSLLLHMSGANGSTTFSDSSSAARTVTPSGSAAISTAQSRFGGSSGYFNMSADYLDIANNAAFDFGTGDFTIETWFYASAASGENYYPIFHNSLLFYAANTGSNSGRVMVFDGSTNVVDTGVSGNVFSLNTWTHLAWVRSSGVITIYVDGISKASATVSGSISSGSPNRIGRFGSASFSGATAYIDDLRITKGVARTITVPTAAYPDE
jgi:hypothetical protein